MSNRNRVLIVGLDGATWDLMGPWMQEGGLHNLRRLRDDGVSGRLTSTIHPVTTPAWTSFLTGQQQGRHGIYDHVHRRPGTYKMDLTNASMIKSPTIFDYLGRNGLRSVSLNIPYTFPPRPIAGLMVSGLFATVAGPEITQPPELFAEIAQVAPGYVVHPDFDPQAPDPLQRYLDDYLASIENRFKVAEYLMDREDWTLFSVAFTATDQIQHAFWHCLGADPVAAPRDFCYRHAIREVYEAIDTGLPRLLERVDDDTLVVVMSDHGAGELYRVVHLNRWLYDHGYLSLKTDGAKRNWRSAMLKGAASTYKKYLPVKWRARIRRWLGMGFERAKSEFESQLFSSPIIWETSRAYSMGACGNIFINLKGREPGGIVLPGAEYEALRSKMIAELAELRDPDSGELVVHRVYRREELYNGPYLDRAPDLIIQWRDYRYWGRGRYDQNMPPLFEPPSTWDFSELPLSGTHRPDGVLVVRGPGAHVGTVFHGARLIDLAPTFLAYLGLPVPVDMDGQALEALFEPGFLQPMYDTSPGFASEPDAFSFSQEDEARITQRLEELGYL